MDNHNNRYPTQHHININNYRHSNNSNNINNINNINNRNIQCIIQSSIQSSMQPYIKTIKTYNNNNNNIEIETNKKINNKYRQYICKQLYKVYQTSANSCINTVYDSREFSKQNHKQKQNNKKNSKHKSKKTNKYLSTNNNNIRNQDIQQINIYTIDNNNSIDNYQDQDRLKSYRYKSIQFDNRKPNTNKNNTQKLANKIIYKQNKQNIQQQKHKTNKYDPYLQSIKSSMKLKHYNNSSSRNNILKQLKQQTIHKSKNKLKAKQNIRNSVNSLNSARSIYSQKSMKNMKQDRQIYSHRTLHPCGKSTIVNNININKVEKGNKNEKKTKKVRRFLTEQSSNKNNKNKSNQCKPQKIKQSKKQQYCSEQQQYQYKPQITQKYNIQQDELPIQNRQYKQNQQISSILYYNNDIQASNNIISGDNSSIIHNIIQLQNMLVNCHNQESTQNNIKKEKGKENNKENIQLFMRNNDRMFNKKQSKLIIQGNYYKKQKYSIISSQNFKPTTKLRKYNRNTKYIHFADNKRSYRTITNQLLNKQTTTNHTQHQQSKQFIKNQKIPSHIQSLPSLESIQSLVSHRSHNMNSYRKKGKLNKNNPLIMKSIQKIRHNFPKGFFNQNSNNCDQ